MKKASKKKQVKITEKRVERRQKKFKKENVRKEYVKERNERRSKMDGRSGCKVPPLHSKKKIENEKK